MQVQRFLYSVSTRKDFGDHPLLLQLLPSLKGRDLKFIFCSSVTGTAKPLNETYKNLSMANWYKKSRIDEFPSIFLYWKSSDDSRTGMDNIVIHSYEIDYNNCIINSSAPERSIGRAETAHVLSNPPERTSIQHLSLPLAILLLANEIIPIWIGSISLLDGKPV